MTNEKEIIYPFFLECCAFCTDIFWTNIFEELSYGKCPYGSYISKDFICCNYKNKEFSYKIEKKHPKILQKEIYDLFSKKLGLLSYTEKLQKRLDFNNTESSIKDARKNWSTIRKKNIKDLLIEKYVLQMQKKHQFSIKHAKYLLSLIYLALVFKVITQKDIQCNDGKIESIDGITFVNQEIFFTKHLYSIDTTFTPQIIIDRVSLSESWEPFLKSLMP